MTCPLVRARRRQRVKADVGIGRSGRHRDRVHEREPGEELGVGRDEVKGDGVRRVVGDDTAREVAVAGVGRARGAADDVRERVAIAGVRSEDEVALERAAEVLRADQLAV